MPTTDLPFEYPRVQLVAGGGRGGFDSGSAATDVVQVEVAADDGPLLDELETACV